MRCLYHITEVDEYVCYIQPQLQVTSTPQLVLTFQPQQHYQHQVVRKFNTLRSTVVFSTAKKANGERNMNGYSLPVQDPCRPWGSQDCNECKGICKWSLLEARTTGIGADPYLLTQLQLRMHSRVIIALQRVWRNKHFQL